MLRFCTAGESHGEALISVISGVPAGVEIDQEFVNRELWRRQQGYGRGGRMRIERDTAHFISGVRHGKTIGSPETTICTRRFCWRPAAVALLATGSFGPNPWAVTLFMFMPCPTR